MSRTVPWRNKPTNFITQMIPVAKQLKLYLVHQIGPTSLVLKDDNDNKFKVVIGNTISCSCAVVKNDHCIHTLFVLLKKFKVNEQHPILWQASYIDSQLDGLTQHKYQFLKNGQSKKKVTNIASFLKKKHLQKHEQEDFFPPLDDEQMCPICYEQMNGQCYSTCNICNKSLHTNCFKVWTKHKEDSKTNVTCPMCRSIFSNPMKIIFRDLQRWQMRFSTHKGTNCKGCGQKNIKGLIYKCLLCPLTDLCKMCYQGNQHLEHAIFVVKELVTDKWKIAPLRIKKTRKQLFQPINQINMKQFSSIQQPQFILKLLPTFKIFNANQNQASLGIVGNQMLSKNFCMKCQTPGNQMMIRLNCGHGVHEQCLLYMFQNKQHFCQIDDQPICPGYLCALGIKVVKQKKSKQKIQINTKFIKNIQQIALLQKKNAENPFSIIDNQNQKGLSKKNKININDKSKLKLKSTFSSKQSHQQNIKSQQFLQQERRKDFSEGFKNLRQGQGKLMVNRISGKISKNIEGGYFQGISKSKDNKNFRINLNKKSVIQKERQKRLDIQTLSIGGLGLIGNKGAIEIIGPVGGSFGLIKNYQNNNNRQNLTRQYKESPYSQHIIIQNLNINGQNRPPLNKKKPNNKKTSFNNIQVNSPIISNNQLQQKNQEQNNRNQQFQIRDENQQNYTFSQQN